MGQSLRVETPAQDPQKHNNGGEFLDSLVRSLCTVHSSVVLHHNTYNMKLVCSLSIKLKQRVALSLCSPFTFTTTRNVKSLRSCEGISAVFLHTLACVAHLFSHITLHRNVICSVKVEIENTFLNGDYLKYELYLTEGDFISFWIHSTVFPFDYCSFSYHIV